MTNMKIRKILLILIAFFFVACFFSLEIFAQEDITKTEEHISDVLSDIAKDVSNSSEIESIEDIFEGNIGQTGEALLDSFDISRLISEISAMVSSLFKGSFTLLCAISGILFISAVCHKLCQGLSSASLQKGFEFCSSATIGAAFISLQISPIDKTADFFDSLTSLVEALIPVTGIVWAMGGNVSTASVGTATLYFLLALMQKLCAAAVVPVCCIMMICAVCSAVSDGGLLGGFTGAVKKIYNFFIAAIMVIVVFALGAQTSIAASADTVAARGGQLLTSTLIPGVGGAIGDTLRTVAGSVQYVKSVIGFGGILFVGALTLPTIISLLMVRLVFLITSALAQMLECKKEATLLSELGNIYACLLGAVCICAVTFCFCLAVFVKCTVAVG